VISSCLILVKSEEQFTRPYHLGFDHVLLVIDVIGHWFDRDDASPPHVTQEI